MKIITLPNLNDFVTSVTLDGMSYRLHFAWNDRAGFWAFGIRTASNVGIIERIKCVPNWPLLNQYRRPDLPSGEFMCIVQDSMQASIGRNDFVTGKAKFIYMTEAEYNAAV